MNDLFILAFVVMPVTIVLGGYFLVLYTERKYGIDPHKNR